MWGYFFLSNFNSQKFKFSPGIHLNTCKYNVWGMQLERKVMRLHKIKVEKSSFLLNMAITCYISGSTSVTCSLRCIIPTFSMHQSLDKHNF